MSPDDPKVSSRPRAIVRKTAGIAIAAHLFIQAALPLAILARPGMRATDFSWDMFSHRLTCSKLQVVARAGDGPWGGVRLDLDFANWAEVSRVLLPARLEVYARALCDKLRAEERKPIELRFVTECRDDRGGSAFPVTDATRDYCLGAP